MGGEGTGAGPRGQPLSPGAPRVQLPRWRGLPPLGGNCNSTAFPHLTDSARKKGDHTRPTGQGPKGVHHTHPCHTTSPATLAVGYLIGGCRGGPGDRLLGLVVVTKVLARVGLVAAIPCGGSRAGRLGCRGEGQVHRGVHPWSRLHGVTGPRGRERKGWGRLGAGITKARADQTQFSARLSRTWNSSNPTHCGQPERDTF